MIVDDTKIPTAPRDHFTSIAPKWSQFGPPLRPSPDDNAAVQRVVDGLGPRAHAVVLGLTPEIIACTWPSDVRLSAVDHSPPMIKALWPPEKGPLNSEVILGDWCTMPFPDASVDLVAGDGCYVLQTFTGGFDALTREVVRVLKPGGRFVIRVFMRPEQAEPLAEIAREFALARIGSVHAMKLRLLAALHGTSGAGTRLDDVWQAWAEMPPLPGILEGRRGWTREEVVGIESYRGMESRYYLPTMAEFRQVISPYLEEVECNLGSHELAGRCPTLVLARGE